jgi:hypothetical protein
MVYQWFGLKTTRTVFFSLASIPMATVSLGLASKPVVEGVPASALKPCRLQFVGCTSKLTRG